MPNLKSVTLRDKLVSNSIDQLKSSLLTSLFYFELIIKPSKHDVKYIRIGNILYSIHRTYPMFTILID